MLGLVRTWVVGNDGETIGISPYVLNAGTALQSTDTIKDLTVMRWGGDPLIGQTKLEQLKREWIGRTYGEWTSPP